MIADFSCPPDAQPATRQPTDEPPDYVAGRWDRGSLGRLARRLDSAGPAVLAELGDEAILAAWDEALARLLDPRSAARRALDPHLESALDYSPPLLQASLEAMLTGFRGRPARALFARAADLDRRRHGLVLGILAGNVPALAVQVALPALAVGRPVLLKSSHREPFLAAALVDLLTRARPELVAAVAAATWPGGDSSLEEELLATARTVVAFGGREALDDLGRRHDQLVGRGPMVSLAVVGRDAAVQPTAAGLARDVALFEQRGCLSVVAVWVEGRDGGSEAAAAEAMAAALAGELRSLAERWPPPRRDAATLAAVQQMRRDAELRGARVLPLEVAAGSVISEPDPDYRPVPEARAVRVHPAGDLARLPSVFTPLAGRIQGVALAGERAWAHAEAFERLGVRRLARPGELQRPDALWANGERHLVEELADPC